MNLHRDLECGDAVELHNVGPYAAIPSQFEWCPVCREWRRVLNGRVLE